MLNGYEIFLEKFKQISPETYIKVIEFPNPIIIGWINGIVHDRDLITLEKDEMLIEYFNSQVNAYQKFLKNK